MWESRAGHDANGNPTTSRDLDSLGMSVRWVDEEIAGIRAAGPAWLVVIDGPADVPDTAPTGH